MQEWMTLVEALGKGLHGSSLLRFYYLSRACLIKSEAYYDAFDRVFGRIFHDIEGSLPIEEELLEWLRNPENFQQLSPEQLAELERLSNDELMRRFMETLAEQDERHDGGGKWIGTGGHSPYGHGGVHPTGVRVGGPGKGRSAMKVIGERKFKDYRTDQALDVRQIKMALKRLRHVTRHGAATELDLDETIDETCRNAGEIEFVFKPPRRNNLRLLLLMDVGGTMEPYYEPVSKLLTALYEDRGLRAFEAYYFHNTIYDCVYKKASLRHEDAVNTGDLLRYYNEHWKVVFVGDAAMHPAELLEPYGNINPSMTSETPSISWIHKVQHHFDRVVWLNPDEQRFWEHSYTARMIKRVFPMYHLSVEGISDAVNGLVGARVSTGEAA
jgi:uncharacterized protein with von Willebrand factor type A (vWA) domain